ncbi:MAG: DUF302 domain-containing protein [Bacteroidales bacterium]|nr:DUF302 domain-containing protein [Bacteroidales bacterium]MCF8337660.1 DUF302 domain-containing protein [Bacteroidales bacterium]
MNYFHNRIYNDNFENTEEKITEALKERGFGIITSVDVTNTFKEKLNKDFRKYKILGACNPENAYKAINVEDKIGLMLPCNVIVQEKDDNHTEIAAIDPVASMQAVDNENLNPIAETIRDSLKEAIDAA